MLYTAAPAGWFTWNYKLWGEGNSALLCFNWFGEQGKATINGIECQIRKQGIISPEWSLEVDGKSLSVARKTSMFTHTFQIESPQGLLTLKQAGMIGTKYSLESSDDWLASIDRAGMMTPNLTLEVYDKNLEFPIVAFTCWLRLLIRRRDNNNS